MLQCSRAALQEERGRRDLRWGADIVVSPLAVQSAELGCGPSNGLTGLDMPADRRLTGHAL